MEPCIVLVKWLDAMMVGHWNDSLPDPDADLLIFTAGILWHEDDTKVTIVQSMGDGCVGNTIYIPKGMILDMHKLPIGAGRKRG